MFLTECTFIIALKTSEKYEIRELVEFLIGDVNLFFNDYNSDKSCEIEVMIANPNHRRKGLAKESLFLLMNFAVENLQVERFYCKINEDNIASINLFKKIGYKQINYVPAFKEYEYEYIIDNETRGSIKSFTSTNYAYSILKSI